MPLQGTAVRALSVPPKSRWRSDIPEGAPKAANRTMKPGFAPVLRPEFHQTKLLLDGWLQRRWSTHSKVPSTLTAEALSNRRTTLAYLAPSWTGDSAPALSVHPPPRAGSLRPGSRSVSRPLARAAELGVLEVTRFSSCDSLCSSPQIANEDPSRAIHAVNFCLNLR